MGNRRLTTVTDYHMLTLLLAPEFDDALSVDERDDLIRGLRSHLLQLEIENAKPSIHCGKLPPSAKSGEALDIGILTVTLAPIVLRSVRLTIQEWLKNRPVRVVKMKIGDDTIEVAGTSNTTQRRALEIFEARHGADVSSD